MARNIGWGEPAKSNAIKLLEALLSLAYGWEFDDCELKAAVQVEWVSENKLRVTGKAKQKRRNRETTVEIGTTKKDLVKLVEKAGKSLEFPKRQQGEGSSREDREAEAVQTVFDCLRELGVFEEDPKNTKKNQGYWKFTLKLKHHTAPLAENLEEIKLKWKEQNPEESPPPPTNIDWREVCETRLDNQKRLLKNPLTSNHIDFYVPLGLVEPKPKEEIRRGGDVSPEEGSRFYQLAETQITKTYNQPNEFFEQVLRQGESKTSKGRRLAITGEPGAGKTTLCYQIAKWILEQNLGVPILIRLADIGSKPLGEFLLEDWLRDAAGKMKAAPPEYSTAFEELLESGDAWLLLDGVDEMAVASPLAAINRQLAEGWANKVRVVLTCRLNVWDADKNALRDFDVYRNLDFDEKQVKEFIHQWFADNQQREGLLRELAQSNQQRINDLVKNPLRLALLCRTWKNGSKLPDTKAGLYQRFVEAFYTLKDEFAIEPAQQQQLTQALGELAKRAIDGEDKDAKTGEVVSRFRLRQCLVDRVFKDRSELLEWALKLGWLNRVGLASAEEEDSDRAVYAFFHPTFQEYFAAVAVDDWHFFLNHVPHNPDGGNYRIFEPHWKQVILLWLGRPYKKVTKAQKEEFIQGLIEFEDACEDYFYKDSDKGFYEYGAYFLAAAGIAEFKDCSKADEIVAQIVKWGFGYFNAEKPEWRTFLDPVAEGASAALLQTNYGIAINKLIDLLETTEDDDTRWDAAESLGKIGTGNQAAIAALVRIMETPKDDYTRIWETTRDDYNRRRAAESLGKIGTGNQAAIAALVRIMETTKDEDTRWRAAGTLGKIGTGNQAAIAALARIMETTKDDDTRMIAAESLGEIDPGNQAAIAALVRIMETTKDEDTRWRAAETLGKIGTGNQAAIAALVRILETTEDDSTRSSAAESLGQIDPGNQEAIAALVRILETTEDDSTRWRAAESLSKIDPGNQEAIAALVRILETTEDDLARMRAAESLSKIDPGNQEVIAALVRILETTEDDLARMRAAESLSKIGTGNEAAIAALVRILETTEDDFNRMRAAGSLREFVQTEQMPSVVSALQRCFTDEVYKTNFDLYENCYRVIWWCAQKMPYPKFYQAWHGSSLASHPEVPQTTGVGFTPSSLSLNLGELPEILRAAIDSNSELIGKVQLICIDGTKFENPDNPASEIYAEMVMQGCPERQNGEPETMQALKVYCQMKCQGVFLIFYEDTTSELTQGFNPNLLKSLSKFNNATRICIVSDQPDIPLQSFSPSQPNLVADIVGWITEKILED